MILLFQSCLQYKSIDFLIKMHQYKQFDVFNFKTTLADYFKLMLLYFFSALKQLKLGPSKDYSLILVRNQVEKTINSFKDTESLPEGTVLRLKLTKDIKTEEPKKNTDVVKKMLTSLENNIELLLSVSGNDLKLLAELDTTKYKIDFNSDFLQEVSFRANEVLLTKQGCQDISGITNALNPTQKEDYEYEFPVPGQVIGMNLTKL